MATPCGLDDTFEMTRWVVLVWCRYIDPQAPDHPQMYGESGFNILPTPGTALSGLWVLGMGNRYSGFVDTTDEPLLLDLDSAGHGRASCRPAPDTSRNHGNPSYELGDHLHHAHRRRSPTFRQERSGPKSTKNNLIHATLTPVIKGPVRDFVFGVHHTHMFVITNNPLKFHIFIWCIDRVSPLWQLGKGMWEVTHLSGDAAHIFHARYRPGILGGSS